MWTSLLVAMALAGDPPADPPDGRTEPGTEAPVQRGAEVGGSRHDASPPLRELPPAARRKERRVHPVKPLPRPKPPPADSDAPADHKDDK
ncbi:MAG: hypothetical protein QM704_06585 [Anaeromyxobacteraceae bacterium]